jgi:hypothetical protein
MVSAPADFCPLGPPSDITFDLTDFNTGFFHTDRLIEKIKRFVIAQMFNDFCEPFAAAGYTCTSLGLFPYNSHAGGNLNLTPKIAIPSGSTHVRYQSMASDTGRFQPQIYGFTASGTYIGQFDTPEITLGAEHYTAISFANVGMVQMNYDNDKSKVGSVQFDACTANTSPVFVPPAQTAPPGLPPRTTVPVATDPAVSTALQTILTKVETLQQQLHDVAVAEMVPGTADHSSTSVPARDQVVDIVNSTGVLITVTGRPATRTLVVANPPTYFRLGRFALGTVDGWYPDGTLEHDVTVISPLAPGTSRVGVTVDPPMLATVTPLRLP